MKNDKQPSDQGQPEKPAEKKRFNFDQAYPLYVKHQRAELSSGKFALTPELRTQLLRRIKLHKRLDKVERHLKRAQNLLKRQEEGLGGLDLTLTNTLNQLIGLALKGLELCPTRRGFAPRKRG